jgi:hypothetical protein
MPSDFTALNQAIADLTAEVAEDETVESSAVTLINGFGAAVTTAVTAALTADAAANQTSIDAANGAIAAVVGRFVAARTPLAAAVVANTPAEVPPAV